MDEAIRFRPIPPRSPHLNGKVERAQRTTLEFWAAADPKAADVGDQLALWVHHLKLTLDGQGVLGDEALEHVDMSFVAGSRSCWPRRTWRKARAKALCRNPRYHRPARGELDEACRPVEHVIVWVGMSVADDCQRRSQRLSARAIHHKASRNSVAPSRTPRR